MCILCSLRASTWLGTSFNYTFHGLNLLMHDTVPLYVYLCAHTARSKLSAPCTVIFATIFDNWRIYTNRPVSLIKACLRIHTGSVTSGDASDVFVFHNMWIALCQELY